MKVTINYSCDVEVRKHINNSEEVEINLDDFIEWVESDYPSDLEELEHLLSLYIDFIPNINGEIDWNTFKEKIDLTNILSELPFLIKIKNE